MDAFKKLLLMLTGTVFLAGCALCGCAAAEPASTAPTAKPQTAAPKTVESPAQTVQQDENTEETAATDAVKAVTDYAGDKTGFAVYQQQPFGDGTLVLAGVTEGESYPELYFVDSGNAVASATYGSDCWMLNYTDFQGKRIFFGRAAAEASNPAANREVQKATARFADGEASATPYAAGKIISVKNPNQSEDAYGRRAQGYILVSDQKGLPQAFELALADGSTENAAEQHFQGMVRQTLPSYLDTETLRQTCVYRLAPMLAVEELKAMQENGTLSIKRKQLEAYNIPSGYIGKIENEALTAKARAFAFSYHNLVNTIPAGSTTTCDFSKSFGEGTKISCYGVKLSKELLVTEGTWQFARWNTGNGKMIKMPGGAGYYLFIVCVEQPQQKIITFTGIVKLK